jgi:hypothetical protein
MNRLALFAGLLGAALVVSQSTIADERNEQKEKLTVAVFGDWPYTRICSIPQAC